MAEMFLQALEVMGIGMATVFSVLLIFFLVVKLLNKLFPYKE